MNTKKSHDLLNLVRVKRCIVLNIKRIHKATMLALKEVSTSHKANFNWLYPFLFAYGVLYTIIIIRGCDET